MKEQNPFVFVSGIGWHILNCDEGVSDCAGPLYSRTERKVFYKINKVK